MKQTISCVVMILSAIVMAADIALYYQQPKGRIIMIIAAIVMVVSAIASGCICEEEAQTSSFYFYTLDPYVIDSENFYICNWKKSRVGIFIKTKLRKEELI